MPDPQVTAGPSLRGSLLRFILPLLLLLWVVNLVNGYQAINQAVTQAHDRTLLASARTIGERVELHQGHVRVDVPWVALDTFSLDTPGRIYHAVTGPHGEFVSGFDDFPRLPADAQRSPYYPALVSFRDDEFQGNRVRVAALHQPVIDPGGASGMALIQVAETLEARMAVRNRLLLGLVWRQGLLLAGAVIAVLVAVYTAVRPLRRISRALADRSAGGPASPQLADVPREIRPLVNALDSYVQRLDAAHAVQRRFLSDASHQLRTPLAVMMTQVDHALENTDPDLWRESLGALHGEIRNAARLANQLLALARSESGQTMGLHQAVDVVDVARRICLEWSPLAVARGVDLGFEDPEKELGIVGDPGLLHEAVANLVDNAVRYTPAGGQVTVAVEPAADAQRVDILVQDTGPGIAAADREQVMRRFVRLPGSAGGGSGLGLAIARDVVRAHAGQISLLDAPGGHGLCVRVSLPTAPRPNT